MRADSRSMNLSNFCFIVFGKVFSFFIELILVRIVFSTAKDAERHEALDSLREEIFQKSYSKLFKILLGR